MSTQHNDLLIKEKVNEPIMQTHDEAFIEENDALFRQKFMSDFDEVFKEKNENKESTILENEFLIKEIPEVREIDVADKLQQKNIPTDQTRTVEEIAKTFTEEELKGRSAEFKSLADALKAAGEYNGETTENEGLLVEKNEPLIDQIEKGKLELGQKDYEKIFHLNEALTDYINGHINARWKAGKKRFQDAFLLREKLTSALKTTLKEAGLPGEANPIEADDEEQKEALRNVDNLCDYYRVYSKKVKGDMIATYEEKLRWRWNALKTCERDIRIVMGIGANTKERKFIVQEFETLRSQILLLEEKEQKEQKAAKAKESDGEKEAVEEKDTLADKIHKHALKMMGASEAQINEEIRDKEKLLDDKSLTMSNKKIEIEKKKGLDNEDDGLEKEQLKGLQQLDAWVIRNINNGGYMTFGLNKSDRTDFASRFLAMSKRERLYAYYLVESKERVNPTFDGFAKSQVTYVPDLATFKDRMIASKFKIHKRFSGGYIYWTKLARAMSIVGKAKEPIRLMSDAIQEQVSENDNKDINGLKTYEELDKAREQKAKLMLHLLVKMVKQSGNTEGKTEGKTEESSSEKETEKQTTEDRVKNLAKEILDIQKKIADFQHNPLKGGYEDYRDLTEKNLQGVKDESLAGGEILDTVNQVGVETFGHVNNIYNIVSSSRQMTLPADIRFTEFANTVLGAVGSCMGAVAGLIVNLVGIIGLAYGYKSMTELDVAAGLCGVTIGFSGVASSVGNIVASVTKNTEQISNITKSGVVLASVGVIISGVQTASYLTKGYQRKKASQLAKANENPDRFRDGMVKMNRKLGKRQRISAFSGLATAMSGLGLSIAGVAMTGAALLFAPVLGIVGAAVGIVGGIASKIVDHQYAKKMRKELNNAFFNADDLYKEVEEEWKKEHKVDGDLSKKQKETLKAQMMRRMAADLGFYSENDMAMAIAGRYAEYLFKGSKLPENDVHGNMCRAMIKGLGVKYDPAEGVPTVTDIANAMCG